jgi:hypothetical protein
MPMKYGCHLFPCTLRLLPSEQKSYNRNITTLKKIFSTCAPCLVTYLYLWNDGACVTAHMIGTQKTVNQLEGQGHKLNMGNFF